MLPHWPWNIPNATQQRALFVSHERNFPGTKCSSDIVFCNGAASNIHKMEISDSTYGNLFESTSVAEVFPFDLCDDRIDMQIIFKHLSSSVVHENHS